MRSMGERTGAELTVADTQAEHEPDRMEAFQLGPLPGGGRRVVVPDAHDARGDSDAPGGVEQVLRVPDGGALPDPQRAVAEFVEFGRGVHDGADQGSVPAAERGAPGRAPDAYPAQPASGCHVPRAT
jgi:hypothetical protein